MSQSEKSDLYEPFKTTELVKALTNFVTMDFGFYNARTSRLLKTLGCEERQKATQGFA
jgi:hypothetical protein